MKTLKDFINESISGEDLKDLEVCVEKAVQMVCFNYDTNGDVVKALETAAKNPNNSDLYKKVIKYFQNQEYDFDLSDEDVRGSIHEFVKKYAKEEIPNWQTVLKYSK